MSRKTPPDIEAILEELIEVARRDLDPAHCDECQADDAALRLTAALTVVAHQGGLDAADLADRVYAWVAGRSDDEGDTSDPEDAQAT
jgi:hypothetical protein